MKQEGSVKTEYWVENIIYIMWDRFIDYKSIIICILCKYLSDH